LRVTSGSSVAAEMAELYWLALMRSMVMKILRSARR